MPPAEWPTVTLGGRSYVVKYGMLANYELSRNGTDPAAALTILRTPNDPHNFSYILDLWRGCTAHEFKLAKPPQEIPTVEAWIDLLEGLPPVDPNDATKTHLGVLIVPALTNAILKWSADRRAAAVSAQSEAAHQTSAQPTPIN